MRWPWLEHLGMCYRIYFGRKLGSIKLLSSFQRPIHHYLLWPLTSRVPALVGRLTGITTSVAAILSHQLHFRKQATQKHFKSWEHGTGSNQMCHFSFEDVSPTFPPTISSSNPTIVFSSWSMIINGIFQMTISIFPHCHLKEYGIQFGVRCTKERFREQMGRIWLDHC